jgi:hypothetical protein
VWALHVLSTLYPQDEIFARDYVPPKPIRAAPVVQEVAMPNNAMYEGLGHIFANRKRARKGTLSQLLSHED